MSSNTPQWVPMGYIKGAVGVRGWLKAGVGTEYTDSLLDYPQWRLTKDGQSRVVTVAAGKVQGDELQVKLEGIDDRDAAAQLRGFTIEIDRADFAETKDNEYYWADLVGMEVVNREHILLGTVQSLMETGAHDVLVVRGSYGEKLIPFVSHYIDDVMRDEKRICVDWGTDY